MQQISFDVNNQRQLTLKQGKHDGIVEVFNSNDLVNPQAIIPPGDMVMLVNFYSFIHDKDIQNDFINPNGKIKEL